MPLTKKLMSEQKMILDVGCGRRPLGTVNCDLFVKGSKDHRCRPLQPQITPNFVKCDAHCLPFRTRSFNIVISRHVLEHLDNPLVALEEWARVAENCVKVAVPSLYSEATQETSSLHKYSWSYWTLKNLMREVFPVVKIYKSYSDLLSKRQGLLPLIWNRVLMKVLKFLSILAKHELIAVGVLHSPDPLNTM